MPDVRTPEEIRQAVVSRVESYRRLVEDIAVSLYRNPEVGLAEVFASQKLRSILEAEGFAVEGDLAGMPTAFRATWGRGRPAIAFLAEYDALPAIGHGCGHNLIAACSTAAALACRHTDPPGRGLRWLVLGTPAEETVGGKIAMTEAGVFADVDAALIAHPARQHSLGGRSWASHPFELTYRGRSAHAGANPQEGINALDALVMAYTQIRNLRNCLREDARLAGIITHGGDAQNIVPDFAQARFTVRARDWRYLEEAILPKVRQAAEGAAHAVGASVELRHHEPLFRETLEHPVLSEIARRNFEYLGEGVPLADEGDGGVTDVGSVTWLTPCIQIRYAMSDARGHSREMAEATISERGIDATLLAAKVLALSALDLAWNPALLEEARAHLTRMIRDRGRESLRE
jgi:amidohydrolase